MKTILLAEDDPYIQDIYARKFTKEGFLVQIAKDGQEALEKMKQKLPDLLLLDILMPTMDGWEVLKKIRADQGLKNVKVAVISNLNSQDYLQEIVDLGVIKYFLKSENTAEEITAGIREIFK